MAVIFETTYNLTGIDAVAGEFWQQAKQYRILAFSGQMGAGKTTFISALCRFLKVREQVSSPTFAIINEYHFDHEGKLSTIYHMDWYRLKDAEEAFNAGVADCMENIDAYSFIEWPEQAQGLLDGKHLWVTITETGAAARYLKAEMHA